MTRPDLLVPTSGFPNADGSVTLSVFVKRQVDAVRSFANSVTVVAPYPYNPRFIAPIVRLPPSRQLQDYAYDNVRVHFPRYLDAPGAAMNRRRGRTWSRLTLDLIEREDIPVDLVHAHFTYPSGHVARAVGSALNVPFIVTVHENSDWLQSEVASRTPALEAVWSDASCILTVNESARDALSSFNSRVQTVGNGYPADVFFPRDRHMARDRVWSAGSSRLLLCVADYDPRKNQELLIRALPLMEHRDVQLGFVGRDRGRGAHLESLGEKLGVGDRIRFFGPIPNDSLPEYYAAADLLVLPSRSESFGVVQIEAMACGTPVVATPTVGSREVIRSPEVGMVADDFDDAAGFASLLDRALDTEFSPERVSAYAAQFSMDRVGGRIVDVYREVLGGPMMA